MNALSSSSLNFPGSAHFLGGKMVNVEGLLAKRRKMTSATGGSSLKVPEGGSHPSKGKGTAVVSEVGGRAGGQEAPSQPKRTRPGSSEVKHGKGKPLCPHLLGINITKDLWRNPEVGVDMLHHNVREVDMDYLQPQSAEDLRYSAFTDIARLPAVVQSLTLRAQRYEEFRERSEEFELKCRDLAQEVTQLKLDRDSTRKQLEEELSGVRQELNEEISCGHRFHETLGGQRWLRARIDEGISQFKKSKEFTDAVEEASVTAFDDCLVYCRERLANSGRFPGEKFEFLDPDWVEMIDSIPGGDTEAARASQGTSLLPTPDHAGGVGSRD